MPDETPSSADGPTSEGTGATSAESERAPLDPADGLAADEPPPPRRSRWRPVLWSGIALVVVLSAVVSLTVLGRSTGTHTPVALPYRVVTAQDLDDRDLRGADLVRAELDGLDLSRRNLEKASLIGASLRGVLLTGANLRGADLSYADLRSADLTGADLSGVDLTGACLSGAVLDEANLAGTLLPATGVPSPTATVRNDGGTGAARGPASPEDCTSTC
jgi:hypothetical protein